MALFDATDDPLDDQERSRIAKLVVDYLIFEIERFKHAGNQEFLEVVAGALRHSQARDLRTLEELIKQHQLERPETLH